MSVKVIDKFHFELVYGCQLRCVGCPISTLKPKVKAVTVDDFKQCMTNVDVAQVRYLRLFNFGESLLHKDLTGIMQVVNDMPYQVDTVEISTNGQFAYWDDLHP
jgi:molybdenum cofactor biosynthesis enzyme MoaA